MYELKAVLVHDLTLIHDVPASFATHPSNHASQFVLLNTEMLLP